MNTLLDVGNTQVSAGLLIDAGERFPLKARHGVVTPTAEPVSDTAVTPFGLTLRVTPIARNVVRLRTADGVLSMSTTEKMSFIESDGNANSSDTQVDVVDDD